MAYALLTYSRITYVWMASSQMAYVWNLRETIPDINPYGVRKSPGGEPRGCRR